MTPSPSFSRLSDLDTTHPPSTTDSDPHPVFMVLVLTSSFYFFGEDGLGLRSDSLFLSDDESLLVLVPLSGRRHVRTSCTTFDSLFVLCLCSRGVSSVICILSPLGGDFSSSGHRGTSIDLTFLRVWVELITQ